MFTEAVDNFVDNRGLLSEARRAVLPPSELPIDWAKKYQSIQRFMSSVVTAKHPNKNAISTIFGNLWHDWTIIP